jgi:hypothetical protein
MTPISLTCPALIGGLFLQFVRWKVTERGRQLRQKTDERSFGRERAGLAGGRRRA